MKNPTQLLPTLIMAALVGCHPHEPVDHTEAHPSGHDHHQEGHGHHDGPVKSFTAWSDTLEIFAEHPPAIAGDPFDILTHVTVLEDFSPLRKGTVTLEFQGPASFQCAGRAPVRPGIYRIPCTAPTVGTYSGRLWIQGEERKAVQGIALEVHSTSPETPTDEDDDGVVEFLKEQQWQVPFQTTFAEQGTITETAHVTGRVESPPGRFAEVGAPVSGRIFATRKGLPSPGDKVSAGQLLAELLPSPSSPEGAAQAHLALSETSARREAALSAFERAKRLFADRAIPQKEMEDAKRELSVAEESVRAAKNAAALYSGSSTATSGRWPLKAPIAGVVVSVDAIPGSTVEGGATLFQIIDDSEVWITAKVPEQYAPHLRTDRGIFFRVAGETPWRALPPAKDDATALVSIGRTVDPITRTVTVIHRLQNPDTAIRVGGLLEVGVPTGETFEGVVVPRSAVLERGGRSFVFVQVDGEHFEERPVQTGPHNGPRIGIKDGLKEGERVVNEGAHLVRLADTAKAAPAHGHIH
ncbi:MAG: efflux RND transporter periplasmic adaptor subunit [Myxococcales bacterium]|nr:efflux RND transporter periplasmic adaptor subunit [Myxococcales bacterium]